MAKRYRVSGPNKVLGHAPGSTFTADIPEDQEARLLKRGSLVKVTAPAPKKQEPAPEVTPWGAEIKSPDDAE